MRKKILCFALLGFLVLAGCNNEPAVSSDSSESVDSTPISSPSSPSTPSSSTYVDENGIIDVHFNAGEHVTLKARSGYESMQPSDGGYFEFSVTVDPGYVLTSINAAGDRTRLSYQIAGSGEVRNIILKDEDVTITATAALEESTEVPDAAIEGASTMFGPNHVLTYQLTDMMPALGGGFVTDNTTSIGENVAIRQINGSMRGSNVFVRGPENTPQAGNISAPSLGIDNVETFNDKQFTGPTGTAPWDGIEGIIYCSNPLDIIVRDMYPDGSNFYPVDPTLLKDYFYFSSTTEDDLTTFALTLKPEFCSTNSVMVGNFLYLFLMNDMALGSFFLDDFDGTKITSMVINLDSNYAPTSVVVDFNGTSSYQGGFYDAIGNITVTNFQKVDEVADPFAPRTEESASDIYTSHSDLISKLAEGNYTMSIQPAPKAQGEDHLGFDGLPDGLTFSDSGAQSGTIYSFKDGETTYVISDQVSPTNDSHTTDPNTGVTTSEDNLTRGTYAAVLSGNNADIYTLDENNTVSDNTWLSEYKLGTYEDNPVQGVALTADDFTIDLDAVNYHFFTKNADGSYTMSFANDDLIWGGLDDQILSSIFSPLDYLLGDSSVLFNAYWDLFSQMFTGLENLTIDFKTDSIDIDVTYGVFDWPSETWYHPDIHYTISNIGTTSESNMSEAAKADLSALKSHLSSSNGN